jgi:hypothetical protein
MRAAGMMARHAVRLSGGGLAAVETKFKARRPSIARRSQCESAEREEESLDSDGIGDDDTEQRPPQPFRHRARFDCPPAHS